AISTPADSWDSPLAEEDEPERERECCGQARVGQDWKREHDTNTQEQPTGGYREQQSQSQAQEPCRKEGTQNVKRRGSTTAHAKHYGEEQPRPWRRPEFVRDHGRVLLALG